LLPLTIITRTLIFILLAWELYQQLHRPAIPGSTELEDRV
jgi:hypothetical protein